MKNWLLILAIILFTSLNQTHAQAPYPYDLAVIAVTSPQPGFTAINETVCVIIKNNGTNTCANFLINYEISCAMSVTEIVTATIAPGDTYTYCFAIPFSTYGCNGPIPIPFHLEVYTSHWNDGNLNNDTISLGPNYWNGLYPQWCPSQALNEGHQEITQFQVGSFINTSQPSNSYQYTYNVFPRPQLQVGESFNFNIISNYAPGNTIQNNCYLKAYADWNADGVFEESANELFYNAPQLSSDTASGIINVPLNANLGTTQIRLVFSEVSSDSLVAACGTYAYGETENYYFHIGDSAVYDASVSSIASPTIFESPGKQAVIINIENNGTTTISNLPVSFSFNGVSSATEIISDIIFPGMSYIHQFQDSAYLDIWNGPSAHNICAAIDLLDSNLTNNQFCKEIDYSSMFCQTAIDYGQVNDTAQTIPVTYDEHWFRFVNPTVNDISLSLSGFNNNVEIAIFEHCNTLTPLYFSYSLPSPIELEAPMLQAGEYFVRIAGSMFNAGVYNLEITAPITYYSCTGTITNNLCYAGSLGAVDIVLIPDSTGIMASGPHTFAWSNGDSTQSINALNAGNYILTITDGLNQTFIDTFIITEGTQISNSIVKSDVTTLGGNDGEVSITTTGGLAPYTYNWNIGAGAQSLNHLYAGQYLITVTDSIGCQENAAAEITSPIPPGWEVTNTLTPSTIYVQNNHCITLNDTALTLGSMIGAFYEDTGQLVCAGYIFWNNGDAYLTVNISDPGMNNGMPPNTIYKWQVYDVQSNANYEAHVCTSEDFITAVEYPLANNTSIYCVKARSSYKQTVELISGWSIIGLYVDPYTPNAVDLFAPIVSQLAILKDENGLAYWPAYNVNLIGDLQVGKGYQAKMYSAQDLEVEGDFIYPETIPLHLEAGWNMLGYYTTSPQDPQEIFNCSGFSLCSIDIIKNEHGQIYWPFYGLNTIGMLMPGEGYQVHSNWSEDYSLLPHSCDH